MRWILRAGILTIAAALHAQNLTFSGSLESIAPESISIQLSDGRIIDALLPKSGRLAAAALSDGRHVGDQVEVTCRRIPRVYDERADLYRYLELTKLRVLLARPEALAKAAASKAWRDNGNFLKPPVGFKPSFPRPSAPPVGEPTEAEKVLARARTANIEVGRRLINFVADESATRYQMSIGASEWRYADKIESELTTVGFKESRQRIMRDGKPWTEPFAALAGFRWSDGFAGELLPLFACSTTTFDTEGLQSAAGRQVWVFRFSSPSDGCFGQFDSAYQRYFPALAGRVTLDASTGELLRLERKVTGFASAFPIAEFAKEVVWGEVKIGDTSYLLPVAATFVIQFSEGDAWYIKAAYKNHRHFEAASVLTFH